MNRRKRIADMLYKGQQRTIDRLGYLPTPKEPQREAKAVQTKDTYKIVIEELFTTPEPYRCENCAGYNTTSEPRWYKGGK